MSMPVTPGDLFEAASRNVFRDLSAKRDSDAFPTDQQASDLPIVADMAPDLIPYLKELESRAAGDGPAMGFLERGVIVVNLPDLQRADETRLYFGAAGDPRGEKFEICVHRPHDKEEPLAFSSSLRWAGKEPMFTPIVNQTLFDAVDKLYRYAIETGYVPSAPSGRNNPGDAPMPKPR